ncbi:aspartate kinase [Candidatus Curtissbacteria bacterium]|nr:aspartate kinase [Candidatus Curtissbacteria bacterium]
MIILKFGGSSVSSAKNIKNICEIVKKEIERDPIIVVSALGGVTDLLIAAGNSHGRGQKEIEGVFKIHQDLVLKLWGKDEKRVEILAFVNSKLKDAERLLRRGKLNQAALDKLCSYGEILSSYIVCESLKSQSINAICAVSTDFVITDSNFGSAEFIVGITKNRCRKWLIPLVKNGVVPVVTGFIGGTKDGKTTTLGRGGSDYTASILAFSLGASEVQIWTDVDGIFSADPRIVSAARLLSSVSYREASELAFFGAKVLHPRTLKPAIKMGIPVRVLNTFSPKGAGTTITGKTIVKRAVSAISYKKEVTLVNIYSTEMLFSKGFLARIFDVFAKNNISVDLVSVSEVSVSVTLNSYDSLSKAARDLEKFASINIESNLGMVSLVGEGIVKSPSTIREIFDILDEEKTLVRMVSLGATDINLSLVVQYDRVEGLVKALHKNLIEEK